MTTPSVTAPTAASVEVGTSLPPLVVTITRLDLIKYAGASADFNVIHWSQRQATGVGLPGVIAHGMLTMAVAARVVTDWVGDAARLEHYSVRFSAPVPVPDDDRGIDVTLKAVVEEKLPDGRVAVAITATIDADTAVLTAAKATVRLG